MITRNCQLPSTKLKKMTSWELLLLFYFGTKKNCRDMSNSTFIVGRHRLKLSPKKKKKPLLPKLDTRPKIWKYALSKSINISTIKMRLKICSIKIYQHINNKNEVEVSSIDKFSKIDKFLSSKKKKVNSLVIKWKFWDQTPPVLKINQCLC